jgi:hypothetical protein
MATDFFFFGSLRDADILATVLGEPLGPNMSAPAWLDGYRTERAEGYAFPLLTADPNGRCEGLFVPGLSPSAASRIAYFEDSDYVPQEFAIRTADGPRRATLFWASHKLASSGELWSFDAFVAQDKPVLLAVTRHVMQVHYGVTPQDEMERMWGALNDRFAADHSRQTRS